jgi:hypothetical protein
MGTYTPEEMLLPVGLDEAGLRLALERLPSESLSVYRRRLLLEARDPSDPTQSSLIKSTGRKVGNFELPIFIIDLVKDSSGDPTAADPYIEVTSTHMRLYNDKDAGTLELEISFATSRWMLDVYNLLLTSTYFSVATGDDYEPYKESSSLRYENSHAMTYERQLFQSYQNSLPHSYLKEIWFSSLTAFQEEKATQAEVLADGDYFVDRTNGVVWSHSTQQGSCSYTYRKFPFTCCFQSVRVLPGNDPDLDYLHKDMLISDETGTEQPLLLNPLGAELYNRVLVAHPLGWGE